MRNPGEMIVAIVFIVMAGSVLIHLIKALTPKRDGKIAAAARQEADELRDQVFTLEDRIRVLERIVTEADSRNDLRRQFRDLERGRS